MPHTAPPPPNLHGKPPHLKPKGPPGPPRPELRPERELEDNPTMHADHELPGRPFEPRFARNSHGHALVRAAIFGTVFATLVWAVLSIADISVNVILPVIAPIWVGSISLLYAVLRNR